MARRGRNVTVRLGDAAELLEEMARSCRVTASEVIRAGIRLVYREWIANGRDCRLLWEIVELYGGPRSRRPFIEELGVRRCGGAPDGG